MVDHITLVGQVNLLGKPLRRYTGLRVKLCHAALTSWLTLRVAACAALCSKSSSYCSECRNDVCCSSRASSSCRAARPTSDALPSGEAGRAAWLDARWVGGWLVESSPDFLARHELSEGPERRMCSLRTFRDLLYRELLSSWERRNPLLVHCWAGNCTGYRLERRSSV